MLQPERTPSTTGRIEAASVAAVLDAMAPREVRVLAGLDAATLADLLGAAPPTRRPVHIPLAAVAAVSGVARR